jgi:hypothetical protein
MTSSTRENEGKISWDLNVRKFKDHDPFCEPGLISILFIAKGRSTLTRRCLESTAAAVALYEGEVEWIFIENGEDDENYSLFQNFECQRKIIVRQKNYGINHALNQAWALSRGEFCLVHENDWFNNESMFNFLEIIKEIFEERSDISIIQMRAFDDPNENWGFGKPEFNPWSCRPEVLFEASVDVTECCLRSGYKYLVSNFGNGFNNNPVVIRKNKRNECGPMSEPVVGSDPRHDETHYQEKMAGARTAYIGKPIYYHAGGAARNYFEATGVIR